MWHGGAVRTVAETDCDARPGGGRWPAGDRWDLDPGSGVGEGMAPNAEQRWHGRPVAAALVRAFVIAVPVVAGLAAAWAVARALPQPEGLSQFLLAWLILIAISTAVVVLVERSARRLLPLAFLLELSLLFPGEAPSRFRMALRRRGVRDLERELEEGDPDASSIAATILGLVASISAHDRRTRGHSERVRAYAAMIGEEMGLDEGECDRLRWAALLHDVGKLGVPREILNKSGEPSDEEWQVIHRHPAEGARLAAPLMDWLGEWGLAIEQHHEHWDGTGYPRQLSGQDISRGARIVAVADAYETMTALRAYNRPLSAEQAREELARSSGTHFDPQVVRAFLGLSVARLRRVAGPLVWIAELPMLAPLRAFVGQPAAATTASAALGVAAMTAIVAVPGIGVPEAADGRERVLGVEVAHDRQIVGPEPSTGSAEPRDDRSTSPAATEEEVDAEIQPSARDATADVAPRTDPRASIELGGAATGPDAAEEPRARPSPARSTSPATSTEGDEPAPDDGADDPGGAGGATADGEAEPEQAKGKPEQPPDPPEHAEADPDPDTSPGTPADPDPRGDGATSPDPPSR